MRRSLWVGLAVVGLAIVSGTASAAPLVERFLVEGKLAAGERALEEHLKANPGDDEARFGLGTLQFLQAIEHLGQSLHQHGAIGSKTRVGQQLPILRLGVPENPKPEVTSYADVRKLLETFIEDLAAAEKTLAGVKDKDVKLPLHFAEIRLDLDGDERASADEALWKLYSQINRGARLTTDPSPEAAETFVIAFDYGDVHWLRGYCHLLSALCETTLMYDEKAAFDAVAPHLFAKPDAPALPADLLAENRWESDIADAVAAIHLMRFPVKEPKRGKAVLEHLSAVIDHSRQSWKAIEAETDNDREWVPNPEQDSVMPNGRVTKEMIAGWHEFLDEAEDLLSGKKLVPHWRLREGRGINLKQVFAEPREFDAVMWAHGAGVLPFVAEGECSTPETWNRFNQIFRGQFIGFALWFN